MADHPRYGRRLQVPETGRAISAAEPAAPAGRRTFPKSGGRGAQPRRRRLPARGSCPVRPAGERAGRTASAPRRPERTAGRSGSESERDLEAGEAVGPGKKSGPAAWGWARGAISGPDDGGGVSSGRGDQGAGAPRRRSHAWQLAGRPKSSRRDRAGCWNGAARRSPRPCSRRAGGEARTTETWPKPCLFPCACPCPSRHSAPGTSDGRPAPPDVLRGITILDTPMTNGWILTAPDGVRDTRSPPCSRLRRCRPGGPWSAPPPPGPCSARLTCQMSSGPPSSRGFRSSPSHRSRARTATGGQSHACCDRCVQIDQPVRRALLPPTAGELFSPVRRRPTALREPEPRSGLPAAHGRAGRPASP